MSVKHYKVPCAWGIDFTERRYGINQDGVRVELSYPVNRSVTVIANDIEDAIATVKAEVPELIEFHVITRRSRGGGDVLITPKAADDIAEQQRKRKEVAPS